MFTLRLLGTASLAGPEGPVGGRATLRQRVALLALLAVEHPRPLSRDKLVAYLWPESDTGQARHLLRETLYILRSALGDDSVLGTGDDLRLNPAHLTCDVWEFEAALVRDDPEGAVRVYGGAFLDGFHIPGTDEFERWIDGERTRLARGHAQALEALAERALRAGDPVRAAQWWSRLASQDPYNSRIALRYMQSLEAAGDRAGALRHAGVHSELLRTDLDAAPEAEVVALAERLRRESRAASTPVPGPAVEIAVPPAIDPAGWKPIDQARAGPGQPTRRWWIATAVLVLAVVLGLGVLGGSLTRVRSPVLTPKRVAAAPFENRTGRVDLDDLGELAADWVIRGMMETPLLRPQDLEAVYRRRSDGGSDQDPFSQGKQDSAGLIVRGSYYLSGDSVWFQASIVDVASGRMVRSLAPAGARLERAIDALEALRERIASGLGPVVTLLSRGNPVDPDLQPPPSLPAYREFVAGLREVWEDPDAASLHYRRAAELDSTFVAPLIQLAFVATWFVDDCPTTDSIAVVLKPRRDRLTDWDRMTIDLLRSYCRGDVAHAVDLLSRRHAAYPRSSVGRVQLQLALQGANRPEASREILVLIEPERDLMWRSSPKEVWPRHWERIAYTWHMLGEYATELAITERWRDSSAWEWQEVRARALAALGRKRDVMETLRSAHRPPLDLAAYQLSMATELAVHGHQRTARTIAESVLARLEPEPDNKTAAASSIAWAARLLGRAARERAALELDAREHPDTVARLGAQARIAVLSADTARAEAIDSVLAEWSDRPLVAPWVRSELLVARAHIAAGFGKRERAVVFLQEASARGYMERGHSHEYHRDLLLAPLRGYPPFEALLKPDG